MSSDSSEEEDLSAFREVAVCVPSLNSRDSTLLSDRKTKGLVPKPSLRVRDDDDKHNHMKVTLEFQAFIAKRLSKFLDSGIKEVKETPHEKRRKKSSEDPDGVKCGVRLLGASSCFLASEEEKPKASSCRKRQWGGSACPDDIGALTEKQKCEQAAVSPEWVLSRRAVAGWEPSTKGEVVVLKGSKKNDEQRECGKGKNGQFPANEPQPKTEEERRQEKKLKRFRCKQRLKLQKPKETSNGASSIVNELKKKKEKGKKLITSEYE